MKLCLQNLLTLDSRMLKIKMKVQVDCIALWGALLGGTGKWSLGCKLFFFILFIFTLYISYTFWETLRNSII